MIETIAVEKELVMLVGVSYERVQQMGDGVEHAVYLRVKASPTAPALANHIFTGSEEAVAGVAQALAHTYGVPVTDNAHGA